MHEPTFGSIYGQREQRRAVLMCEHPIGIREQVLTGFRAGCGRGLNARVRRGIVKRVVLRATDPELHQQLLEWPVRLSFIACCVVEEERCVRFGCTSLVLGARHRHDVLGDRGYELHPAE